MIDAAIVQVKLRFGVVAIPVGRATVQHHVGTRYSDHWMIVTTACFNKQHLAGRIFRQSIGDNAPGGTGPDDYEVVAHNPSYAVSSHRNGVFDLNSGAFCGFVKN